MIKALRSKFILTNMLLVFIVLFVVFTMFCTWSYQRQQMDSNHTLTRMLERREDQPRPMFELGQKPPEGFVSSPVFVLRVRGDGEAELVFAENISVDDDDIADIAALVLASGEPQGVLRRYNLRYVSRSFGNETKIALTDRTAEVASLRSNLLTSLLAGGGALVAFFFVSLFLSRLALRPVERAWRQQHQFVADASHELKTPLTVILANTGILKSNRDSTIAEQINWVENTEAEAKRMKKLVDDLLFLAKADDVHEKVVFSQFHLSDAVFSAALAFESVAFERGVELDMDITPDISVTGSEQDVKQLVGILLDNAIKYSPAPGVVRLRLRTDGAHAMLQVNNAGAVVAGEEMEHLFERFYRADKSRSKEGYGLGLAIAKSITDTHKGEISVRSNRVDGTTFTVSLPMG